MKRILYIAQDQRGIILSLEGPPHKKNGFWTPGDYLLDKEEGEYLLERFGLFGLVEKSLNCPVRLEISIEVD